MIVLSTCNLPEKMTFPSPDIVHIQSLGVLGDFPNYNLKFPSLRITVYISQSFNSFDVWFYFGAPLSVSSLRRNVCVGFLGNAMVRIGYLYGKIRKFCTVRIVEMKYLNVAEKNDAAKTIAGFLSNGSARRVSNTNIACPLTFKNDFPFSAKDTLCIIRFTSLRQMYGARM